MNIDELSSQLHILGADVPVTTLQRWAANGVIPSSTHKWRGRGRPKRTTKERSGRSMDYPPEAVEDAAAVWSIYRWSRERGSDPPTIEALKKVRYYAQEFYDTATSNPQCSHLFKEDVAPWKLEDAPPPYTPIIPEESDFDRRYNVAILSRWVGEGKQRLLKAPFIHSSTYHTPIVLWVCAIEKVRRRLLLYDKYKVIFEWSIEGRTDDNTLKGTFEGVRVEKAEIDRVLLHRKRADIPNDNL